MKPNDYIYISSVDELNDSEVLAQIGIKGGSITRLQVNGHDKLWTNPTLVWPRREKLDRGIANQPAPILFPNVGSLKTLEEYNDGSFIKIDIGDKQGYIIDDIFYLGNTTGYFYKDKFYSMSKHGFAKICKFSIVDYQNDRCLLRLNSSYKTKQYYPFDFSLYVSYKAVDYGIDIEYILKNTGSENLPYNIGDHPGFSLDKPVDHYYLKFDKNTNAYAEYTDKAGNKQKIYVDSDNRLPLLSEMFENKEDVVTIHNLDAKSVSLYNIFNYNPTKPEITYDIDSDSVVLWSADPNGFICIEPWYARRGSFNNLEENMANGNIAMLKPGEEFSVNRRLRFPSEEYTNRAIMNNKVLAKRFTQSKKSVY